MTSVLEKIVAIIAPHRCILCSKEDNILCDNCLLAEQNFVPSVCCICGVPSPEWRVCGSCKGQSNLSHIWPAGLYKGCIEQLIRAFKFERVKQAAAPLSTMMLDALPFDDWTLVYVPTAPSRVRQRGYDQAQLLVKEISRRRQLVALPALRRVKNERQVGANRVQRKKQSQDMFTLRPGVNVKGVKIVLIDDVCTTGATLSAAAACLRAAGAAEVNACVAAWRPPQA